MIATPTALLVCGTWAFCWSTAMPRFFPSLDMYPEIPLPAPPLSASGEAGGSQKDSLRSRKRTSTTPKTIDRRTIHVPLYVPPLQIPAWLNPQWRRP